MKRAGGPNPPFASWESKRRFLSPQVIGMDLKPSIGPALESDPELMPHIQKGHLRLMLGPQHDRGTILSSSVLVLSPGVPLTQPDVAAALGAGVHVTSEMAFAYECLPEVGPPPACPLPLGSPSLTHWDACRTCPLPLSRAPTARAP